MAKHWTACGQLAHFVAATLRAAFKQGQRSLLRPDGNIPSFSQTNGQQVAVSMPLLLEQQPSGPDISALCSSCLLALLLLADNLQPKLMSAHCNASNAAVARLPRAQEPPSRAASWLDLVRLGQI